jgi:hypothetical protein
MADIFTGITIIFWIVILFFVLGVIFFFVKIVESINKGKTNNTITIKPTNIITKTNPQKNSILDNNPMIKKLIQSAVWKWFWGVVAIIDGFVIVFFFKLYILGVAVILGTLLIMPYFGELISKILKFKLSKITRIFILIFIAIAIMVSFTL